MSKLRLTPLDVAAIAGALTAVLSGFHVRSAVRLTDCDDLLLYLVDDSKQYTLQIAPGGTRARITTTARRFPKHRTTGSGHADLVAQRLADARLIRVDAVGGSRALALQFRREDEPWTLHVELFGPRGLWALCNGENVVVAMSRKPTQKDREIEIGKPWQPAPPTGRSDDSARQFEAETPAALLARVDEHFQALDRADELGAIHDELATALARAQRREADRRRGLSAQLQGIEAVPQLRESADMLLAMAHTLLPGQLELRVPAPLDPAREVVVPRDLTCTPIEQAQRIYDKARRLEASRSVTERQLEELDARAARLAEFANELATLQRDHVDDEEAALRLRARFAELHLLPPPPRIDPAERQRKQKLTKITRGENFRRFRSHDGNLILVGRDNEQNDRLSIKVARGNDLWCHVGRGYAGSHVVVRLERGRAASQETLLDAGTLALHFSKVRGTAAEEVIFTAARNVKKPKGLPPGKVVATQTKSHKIRMEPERLARLLASAGED
ncbi:MAG: NFACT RNA binding domain-containing protein [Planctomycetota bacterium]